VDYLFATQQTSLSDLIGRTSVTASIRFSPVHLTIITDTVRFRSAYLREKITFLAPYGLLCAVIWSMNPARWYRLQQNVAFIIYLSSLFGFAIHNFQIPKRAHFVNGMIWGFLSGLLITTLAAR